MTQANSGPETRHDDPAAAAPPTRRRWLWYWIGATVVGLLLRIGLLPTWAGLLYAGDHDDFVRWGMQAADRSVLTLYTEPPARHDLRVWDKKQHRWFVTQRKVDRVCNYPPGAAYLLYASGLVFERVSDDLLVNSPASLATFTSWGMLGDLLLGGGCAAIVGLFRRPWGARLTYGLLLMAPPFWWDSLVWAQMDTVLLAPAAWMVYSLLRRRWLLAGVLWGLMFSLKPQAILFVPVWAYVVITWRPRWQPIAGAGVAVATLLVIALPFTLSSGLAWLRLSYFENLFATYANLTTMKAFNFWYLDLLINDSLNAFDTRLGLTKATWGKIALVGALLLGVGWTLWRFRRDDRGLVVWTAYVLLMSVFLPTAVHERYLILALPFVGVAAAFSWRVWPGLLMLLVVMMAQLSWPLWLRSGRGQWEDTKSKVLQRQQAAWAGQSPAESLPPGLAEVLEQSYRAHRTRVDTTLGWEWVFTIVGLAGAMSTVAALAAVRPQPLSHVEPDGIPNPTGCQTSAP